MHSVLKGSLICGLVGLGLAVLFWVAWLLTGVFAVPEAILWPGSLGFMAEGPSPGWLSHVLNVGFVIFTNFVLYFVVGFVLILAWKAAEKLGAWHRH